ncbi:MAG TPA: exodeoxyribonuclease VII small subunit [Xanthomonadales bacterium]|nr:exodeoxyribonuclease VII small subunit [Xanthomonadales bacterium]
MSKKKAESPGFEQALTELEALVAQLESGDLSLDQSLTHFKRGVELTRHCQSILDDAQQTVEILSQDAAPDSAVDLAKPPAP